MARYIDANKLIEVIEDKVFDSPLMHPVMKMMDLMELIEEQPTADVVEVVHGEWEEVEEQNHVEKVYICTACRNYEAWGEYEKTPYCPNCGAKMDGKKVE